MTQGAPRDRPTHYVRRPEGGVRLVDPEGMKPELDVRPLPDDFWERPRRYDAELEKFVNDDRPLPKPKPTYEELVQQVRDLSARVEQLELACSSGLL